MTQDERLDARYALAYRADYSARYHRRRASFLKIVDSLFSIFVIIAGASAFVSLIGNGPVILPKAAALAVALVTVLQVVLEIGPSAARHGEWMRRWDRLGTKIRQNSKPSQAVLNRWEDVRAGIEGECVSEFKALAVVCENDARRFLGDTSGIRKVTPLERCVMHVGSFRADFPLVEENLPPPPKPDR